ncbi:hypothetical protein SAMN05421810_103617 [Amycolatopsis arida]|uniref:Glycoprotein n=2 Tax=Amycolatopsis arida TaxID=587909 RepID=A0A1I5TRX6_9PSEU|nr:DUF6049 family protein [Amycolatopsis arida]TDX96005.1 hypothetical protein CLV69_103140 [Amycolatopsis arida]SFP85357.1 hypothetical protein SAMN05421810_103617 [Amycolatopsis arida]
MSSLAALALALLFVAAQALFAAGASAQQLPGTPNRLRMDIDRMTPRMITADTERITVIGTVANVGDRRITDLKARLQLGERQTSDRRLAETMAEVPPADAAMTRFVEVAPALEPGQSAPLTLTVPVNNGAQDGLRVAAAGVYPLLINVNGTPDYGGPARLAALTMLVPVLGIPGVPGGGAEPRPEQPTPVAMLWPIADTRPRVVSAPYNAPVVLSDDQLAADLAPGGRLDALVAAAEGARDDSRIFGSLCFAVDPDLLETVEAMTRGYLVRTPTGDVEGRGAATAARWLESLRQLVKGRCVVQIPFADADLTALSRIPATDPGFAGLTATAVGGAPTVQRVLNMQPQEGVLWPTGTLDEATLAKVSEAGVVTVITDAARLQANTKATGTVELAASAVRAVPYDTLVARSLAGRAAGAPRDPVALTPADEPDVAVQNAVAVLAFRGGLDQRRGGDPVLIAPPHRWSAPTAELATLLDALDQLTSSGRLAPTSLQQLMAGDASGTATMGYASPETNAELPGDAVSALTELNTTIADVGSAMSVDPTAQVQPAEVLRPLRNGLIRATATSLPAWPAHARGEAVGTARAQVDELRRRVTVVSPGQPYSLASGASPIPVSISSSLPVVMTVRITLTNSTGLRPEEIGDVTVPADSAINQRIHTEALRAGRFNVYVSLTTPSGTELGTPARFDLRSTEYGVVTLVVTIAAGGALLLLSARRIYRRVRAARSGAPERG